MKILHVTPYFAPAWLYGGVPRSLHGLAREQVRQGDAVRVIATDVLDETRRDPGERIRRFDGIEAAYLPNVSNRLAQRFQVYFPRSGWKTAFAWCRDADVVHFHCHRILFFHVLARALAKRPYFLSPRGSGARLEGRLLRKRLYDRLWGDRFLAGAELLFALSEGERDDLIAAGASPARIRVIPHGIDWDARARSAASGQRPANSTLLYLGKVTPLKGLEPLLVALAGLPDVTLAIAGNDNGGYARRLDGIARSLGLAGRVRWLGWLDEPAKADALAQAAAGGAVVVPSQREAFGLVPLEALAAGVPVAVSCSVGCAGRLRAMGLAAPMEPEDPDSIREAVRVALGWPERGAALAERARRALSGELGWEAIAGKYRAAYAEIVR